MITETGGVSTTVPWHKLKIVRISNEGQAKNTFAICNAILR